MACRLRPLLIGSIPFFLLFLPTLAQTGTFTGQVTDSTQAVLPGTEVTLVNLETGESRTVITGNNGFYRATNMFRANYELSAALDGFKTLIRKDIELTVGEIKRVDFALDPGAKSIRIAVSGEAPMVNTEEPYRDPGGWLCRHDHCHESGTRVWCRPIGGLHPGQ